MQVTIILTFVVVLVQSVTIDGFDIGITIGGDYSVTLEHITLRNQRQIGVRNWNCAAAIRDLTIANAPLPVALTAYVGFFTIVDGQFTGGTNIGPAITNACQKLFLRNVTQQGYTKMVASVDSYYVDLEGTTKKPIPHALPPDLNGTTVTEYVSHGVQKLFDVPERTLNLPVKETPDAPWDDTTQWVGVAVTGPDSTFDASNAIQNAFTNAAAQGKSTVYLKPLKRGFMTYQLKRPIRVRGSVHRFIGMGANIEIIDSLLSSQNTVFDIDSLTGSGPIVFERFLVTPFGGARNFRYFINKTQNPLVIRDISFNVGDTVVMYTTAPGGSGELYIQDVCAAPAIDARHGQKVWARQLNPESATWVIRSDSADIWIFGQKTEGRPVFAELNNNSHFELLGGDFEQTWGNNPIPPGLFVINNSSASFMYAMTLQKQGYGFPVHVLETQAGVTKQLVDSQLIHIPELHAVPLTATVSRYDEIFLPLFVAGSWRGATAAQQGIPQLPSQKNRPALIKRGAAIWLRSGDASGSFRFSVYSADGRCVSTRTITAANGSRQLVFSANDRGGSIPHGIYVARFASGDGKLSGQTMLINP